MGGGGHGHDTQVRVLHGPQLALQQDGFSVFHSLVQEGHGVTHIGLDDLAHLQQVLEELVCVDAGLVIHVLEENVFDLDSVVEMLFQAGLVEQIADLDADLGVLVGVEGGDAALGGAEGMAAQALLFVGVLEDVIGHEQLGPLRDDQVGGGYPGVQQAGQFIGELADVQGDPVADDVGDVRVEHARRQGVQGEAAIIIDDGVPRIGAALEADDDV